MIYHIIYYYESNNINSFSNISIIPNYQKYFKYASLPLIFLFVNNNVSQHFESIKITEIRHKKNRI